MMVNQDLSFETLYSDVLNLFPKIIVCGERSGVNFSKLTGIISGMKFISDSLDKEFSDLDVPSLTAQLSHVLLAKVHQLLLQVDEVEVNRINPEYIRYAFNNLIIKVALPQLNGEVEWDQCFDLNEVRRYAENEGLITQ